MKKIIWIRILSFALVASLSLPLHAQKSQAEPSGDGKAPTSTVAGTRRQLATIIFAGLTGAVLGLSTLSFYGRPQDHMANIAVGFGLGIISGTIYVTYKTATQPAILGHSDLHKTTRADADLAFASPLTPTLNLNLSF